MLSIKFGNNISFIYIKLIFSFFDLGTLIAGQQGQNFKM